VVEAEAGLLLLAQTLLAALAVMVVLDQQIQLQELQ
jgi:hypothetical protein